MARDLRPLLAPRSIAIIGATETAGWSRFLARNLVEKGFSGPIYPVNPKYQQLFGMACYPSLEAIPGDVELAYFFTPTHMFFPMLEACAKKGVRAVVSITAGFAETGDEGAREERRAAAFCRQHGILLMGPNCLGFVNTWDQVCGYGLYYPKPLVRGKVGWLSQSGQAVLTIMRATMEQNIGATYLVSSGNEGVVDACDYLEYMLDDPNTQVVGMYLEGVRRPEKFREIAKKALALQKPMVALKVGRSEQGAKSAKAHTGALAGSYATFQALCRQHGIVLVDTFEELVNTAGYFSYYRVPQGDRVVGITASGGVAGMASDAGDSVGVKFPPIPPAVLDKLNAVLPGFATPQNPLDMTGIVGVNPDLFAQVPAIFRDSKAYDLVINFAAPPREPGWSPAMAEKRVADNAALARFPDLPVVQCTFYYDSLTDYGRELCEKYGVWYVQGIAPGVKVVKNAIDYGRALRELPGRQPVTGAPGSARGWRERLSGRRGALSEYESKALLRDYGVPVAAGGVAKTAEAAVQLAETAGYPVALKIASPDILHKTEAGGVRLGLVGAEAVRRAFEEVTGNARAYKPDARIEGALVEQMLPQGVEVLLGMKRDPVWGPVLVFGLGGVLVEALGDVQLRLAPIAEADAREMIESIRAARVLDGFRGRLAADKEALARALLALSRLAVDLGDVVEEIDLNPVIALPPGQGVVAADALVVLTS